MAPWLHIWGADFCQLNNDEDTLFSLHLYKPTDNRKIMPFKLLLLRSLIDEQYSFMMPKWSSEKSARVIRHLQVGVNPKHVANLFDVHISTRYILKKSSNKDNTVKKKSGIRESQEDKFLKRMLEWLKHMIASESQKRLVWTLMWVEELWAVNCRSLVWELRKLQQSRIWNQSTGKQEWIVFRCSIVNF